MRLLSVAWKAWSFHKTMENYAAAKALLFKKVSERGQVKGNKSAHINADADYSEVMSGAVDREVCRAWTYSIDRPSDLRAENIRFNLKEKRTKCAPIWWDALMYTMC